jgi:predicted nucleic acid-binding OB-fold protein
MNDLFRTRETRKKYEKFIADGFLNDGCNLCKRRKTELIKEFKHWRIIKNIFPWDRVAKTNHIIVPKRHIVYKELTKTEKDELEKIKIEYIEKGYDLIAEATNKIKSIPTHLHIHLIILKK